MLYTPSFAALFLANLCLVASFASFFLFPLFITEHGGNRYDIGIIMGIFALASALCRPWIAEMIDRIGRKRSYTIGCTIMTIMPVLHLFLNGTLSDYYLLLLLFRIIHGIGLAICFTSVFTFIVDLIPSNRLNEGIGIFGTSGLLGMAIGPLIAEPLLHTFGFTAFFLTTAGLAGVALLLQAPIRDRHHLQQKETQPSPSFFALLKTRKQLVCAGLSILFGFGLAATANFITPLVQELKLSNVSSYYLVYSLAAVGIRFIAGKTADRIGEKVIIPWGIFFASTGLLLVPLVHSDMLLLGVGFLFGIGHGLLFPALNAMAVRNEQYAVRGKVTGIFTGGIDAGVFCGALLLGIIGEFAGFTALFIFAGVVVLCGLAMFRLKPATA